MKDLYSGAGAWRRLFASSLCFLTHETVAEPHIYPRSSLSSDEYKRLSGHWPRRRMLGPAAAVGPGRSRGVLSSSGLRLRIL